MTSQIFYGGVAVLLMVSLVKDLNKTKKALRISMRTLINLMPSMIPMMILIGIIITIVNPSFISVVLGAQSGLLGIISGLSIGSIAFLPSFVAFPLGESLLNHGAGYAQIAAFVSSLMAVGIVSINVEMKYFGKKIAIARNLIGLIAAMIFALLIGGVM